MIEMIIHDLIILSYDKTIQKVITGLVFISVIIAKIISSLIKKSIEYNYL